MAVKIGPRVTSQDCSACGSKVVKTFGGAGPPLRLRLDA
ncbi:hypothetical protein RPMA_26900 [Tardiphaga alba]|uniref:Uncharacterized protein n=2 Tax=Tardiphaga alba TaxID=340268 RepID=A0ABX8AHG9_9BRAD|nr:hypothetical protein RPMA_26900 [Tardiphaga alba]